MNVLVSMLSKADDDLRETQMTPLGGPTVKQLLRTGRLSPPCICSMLLRRSQTGEHSRRSELAADSTMMLGHGKTMLGREPGEDDFFLQSIHFSILY